MKLQARVLNKRVRTKNICKPDIYFSKKFEEIEIG